MHHANIILSRENCNDFIFDILQKDLGFNIKANPDFLFLESESFGIDDARGLIKWAIGRPFIGETKVSFIITKSITLEAQNALLKVLEEPILGTYIFINLQNSGGLLATFLSRVRVLKPSFQNNIENNDAHKFLNSKIKEKLSLIQSLSKRENKSEMKELIKNMEEIAYKNGFKSQDLKNILVAKTFASARGSSPKMLLEWLSCML